MSSELLGRAFASTSQVLANVTRGQMDDPTPCASWNVRDLVNHIVGGTTYFAVAAETGVAPDNPAVDYTTGDFQHTFDAGAERAVAAFAAEGTMEKTLTLPFGDLPGSIFVYIAATDTFTHGWDLAKATGQSSDLDPETAKQLLDAVSAFLPDTFRGPDGAAPFGPRVEASASACAADQLAAFMGRTPDVHD